MAKFETGELYQTRGIHESTNQHPELYGEIVAAYKAYVSGDWGILTDPDKEANEEAIANGGRIMGKYATRQGNIYIITEADRTSTMILFCDEY